MAAWIVCFVAGGIYGLLASYNRKEGRRWLWPLFGGSIWMWPKDDFTELGLKYRDANLRYFRYCLVIFALLALMITYLSRVGVF
jgi:hypothetical protein